MSESMSYELSRKLDQRGYEGQMALGYLDAINDLMKIEDRRQRDQPTLSESQQSYLKSAIDEIERSMLGNKDRNVNELYLYNAICFIKAVLKQEAE